MFRQYVCIRQHDISDCAIACIASISKYYKLSLPYSRIREKAGTDKEGTTVFGTVKALTELGFTAKGVKGDHKAFFSKFVLPCIAHVITDNLLHFVVIYKINKNKIIVADPAKGIVTYTPKRFFKIWTGILIVLAPNQSFQKGKTAQTTIGKFFSLLIPQWRLITGIFFVSIFLTALGILSSFYFKLMMDEILPNQLEKTLLYISIGVIALYVFKDVLNFFRAYLLAFLGQRLDLNLIFAYYLHVINLPVSFFGSRRIGEIVSRFTDADKVREAISSATLTIMIDTLMAVGGGIMLFNESRFLFGITVVIVLLDAVVIFLFNKPLKKINETTMENNAQLSSYMIESLNGIELIKSYNAEEIASFKTESLFVRLLKSVFKNRFLNNAQASLGSLISGVGGVIILWAGADSVLKGQLSVGEMLTFNALLSYFVNPIQNLINLQPQMQTAIVAADRLGEILDLSAEDKHGGANKLVPSLKGDIQVKNITFRYGGRAPVLNDVSLFIPKSYKVALVGESGSGKTSLAKLFMRFYSMEKGEIIINGCNINDIDINHLRRRIAYISQNVFLFSGSIIDNMRYVSEDAGMEEIIEACKMAQAHEFINQFPLRYETFLEENGGNLSGGQRQRLSIAQAILKNPDIIIMDEATSNLDSITERAIEKIIYEHTGDVAVLMIAHRLSTIMRCDYIYVMDKGTVVEAGRHNELMARHGFYYNLWKDQIPVGSEAVYERNPY
ncbi:MAG: peptidase domain-containing ABC transporter [Clostridiales bacterium]|nr:peptidase domain-containing ABC transporter [Clostridiales bacterium]